MAKKKKTPAKADIPVGPGAKKKKKAARKKK
jgi:hypothetical protein